MDWNDERISTLEKLWRDGLSASQIAAKLGGVSRSAVIGKVHRLGINGREAPQRPRSLGGRPPLDRTARSLSPAKPRDPADSRPKAPLAPRPAGLKPAPRKSAPPIFVGGPTATFAELDIHCCRWPFGDPGQNDFGYCGRPQAPRSAYCDAHANISRRPTARMAEPVIRERARADDDIAAELRVAVNG